MRIAQDQPIAVSYKIIKLDITGRWDQQIIKDLDLIFQRIDLNIIDIGDGI